MKHILPILTLALLGAAATASAGTTYTEATFLNSNYDSNYSYYLNPTVTTSTDGKTQTIDYGEGQFQVVKYGGSDAESLMYQTYFKVHANDDINFYLYDYVANVYGDNSGNALDGVGVKLIGYRTVGEADDFVVNSDTKEAFLENGEKLTGYKGEVHGLGTPADTEIINREYLGGGGEYQVVRNSYYLGKFEEGKDYEIFISYAADGSDGLWSNADIKATGYDLYEDETKAVDYPDGVVPIDKMMQAYKSESFQTFKNAFESANAMPIAQLNYVYFGMRTGPAVGSPLPGGLPIALIAGLFGLGFWYIRRRKATVA